MKAGDLTSRGWARFAAARTPSDDRGFTLIEVVVAMAVFSVLVSASLGVIVKTGQGAGDNRERVVAASCGASQIEKARTTDVTTLLTATAANPNRSTCRPTATGISYDVVQTAQRVNVSATSTDCGTTANTLEQIRISVTVTWPDMGSTQPVQSDTLLSAPTTGALAVTVVGANGAPQANLPITLVPKLGASKTLTTGTTGCQLFQGLSADATANPYTVSVTKGGSPVYVGPGGAAVVTSAATVTVGSVTRVTMTYDLAGSLTFVPKAADGTSNLSGTPNIPAAFQTVVTRNSFGGQWTTAFNQPVTGLYPGAYKSTVGSCNVGAVNAVAGTSTTVPVPFTQLNLKLPVTTLTAGDVYAVAESGGSCPEGTKVKIGTIPLQVFCIVVCYVNVQTALPAGTWAITWPSAILGIFKKCAEVDAKDNSLAILDLALVQFILDAIPFSLFGTCEGS